MKNLIKDCMYIFVENKYGYVVQSYGAMTWEEIKPEHRGVVALLDAARNDGGLGETIVLKGVGTAIYFEYYLPNYTLLI
jgi:hypothetical protein